MIGTSQQTGPYPPARPRLRRRPLAAPPGRRTSAPRSPASLAAPEGAPAGGAAAPDGTPRAEAAADELARVRGERIKDVTHGRLMSHRDRESGFPYGRLGAHRGPVCARNRARRRPADRGPGGGRRPADRGRPCRYGDRPDRPGPAGRSRRPTCWAPCTRMSGRRRTPDEGAPIGCRLKGDLDAAVAQVRAACLRLRMFFSGAGRKQAARDALTRLQAILGRRPSRGDRPPPPGARGAPCAAAGHDHAVARLPRPPGRLQRPAHRRPGLAPDEESAQGYLPAEIAEQVRDQPLDLSLVTASLRGYQAFGAKFALVQGRVIIGDEMGLGKTLQALAAMAHLAAPAGRGAARPRTFSSSARPAWWSTGPGKSRSTPAHRVQACTDPTATADRRHWRTRRRRGNHLRDAARRCGSWQDVNAGDADRR